MQSPSLWQIVACAFGTQREEKLVPDDRMVGQHIQRLLSCRVDRTAFPLDIKKALVDRASMPQAFSAGVYQRILFTACAVIRKYVYDHNQTKGEITLTLDENREDRSYQFGRLLAVYEKIERDTFERDTTRETNAIRSQCAYRQRPLHIANNLEEKLNQAYMPRLKPGLQHYYRQMIQDIRNKIDSCPEPNKYVKPLGDTYLIGYYHQRSALYPQHRQRCTRVAPREGRVD